jgi:nitrate reductase assembly molybdenum cofactor insertion protein NarJ
MRATPRIHDLAAELLTYPAADRTAIFGAAAIELGLALPEFRSGLESLAAAATSGPAGALEESYAAAFDNRADRALEVGWHAFGENYARGAFLVRMRERIRECGLAETTELPDHLSHVLRVLGRVDERQAQLLTEALVLPAVDKMLAAAPETDMWRPALRAARHVLSTHLSSQEPVHV